MHFGATLRLLRMNAGFTLRDLATEIGVSNAYLSRVENGHDAPPTPDRLAALARAFGLPPTTLIELANRVAPLATGYLESHAEARELMLEIVRRNVGPVGLARIRAFVEREFPGSEPIPSAGVRELLSVERVVADLECDELDDVIDIAAARLAPSTSVSALDLVRAIRARERACSSALGGGLAVPHAVLPDDKALAVIVSLRRPLEMTTPDAKPVRVCLVHVHPGGSSHTRLLAELARLADDELSKAASSHRHPQAVYDEICARLP